MYSGMSGKDWIVNKDEEENLDTTVNLIRHTKYKTIEKK